MDDPLMLPDGRRLRAVWPTRAECAVLAQIYNDAVTPAGLATLSGGDLARDGDTRGQALVGLALADRLVALLLTRRTPRTLRILRLAVAADCRRQGIGRALFRLAGFPRALPRRQPRWLVLPVDERLLDAQLFLRALGSSPPRIRRVQGLPQTYYVFRFPFPSRSLPCLPPPGAPSPRSTGAARG